MTSTSSARSHSRSTPHCLALPLSARMAELKAIVDRTSKTINTMVDRFLDAEAPLKMGSEAFHDRVVSLLLEEKLASKKKLDTRVVGVHPDNRERQGLVPYEAHQLLSLIAPNGWSWSKVNALASEVPPGEIGDAWRAFNRDLIASTDGLLPPIDTTMMEAASGCGSHTTAAVNLMHFGCKGIFENCTHNGLISKSKIIEAQPSMAEPLEGIPYIVLKWQLTAACPRLMEALSRTGNASHGIERVATALQGCSRVHSLFVQHGCDESKLPLVIKQACIGMPATYAESAECFANFVRTQSGGKDAKVLRQLIAFERTLQLKRSILASDLNSLSKLQLHDAPRWISCMIKAMLVSPWHQQGTCTLFSKAELANISPKLRAGILESHQLIVSGHDFVATNFMHPDVVVTTKLLSDFEIRIVMYTHGKHVQTRKKFASLVEIAKSFYDELEGLMHIQGHQLAKWGYLASAPIAASSASSSALVEMNWSGEISDDLLKERHIEPGVRVTCKGEETWIVASFDANNVVLKRKDLQKIITKGAILSTWTVLKTEERISYQLTALPNPAVHADIQSDMWKSLVLSALVELHEASRCKGLTVVHKPEMCVMWSGLTGGAAPKGSLTLVPLSRLVGTCAKANLPQGAIDLGPLWTKGDEPQHGFIKPGVIWPDDTKPHVTPFVVPYWCVKQTRDQDLVNCVVKETQVTIRVCKRAYHFNVPLITNSESLNVGDKLCIKGEVKRQSSDIASLVEEQAPPKAAKGSGKGKRKGNQGTK